jgi:hypothetical protein
MTDRIPLAQHTKASLDSLYDENDRLRHAADPELRRQLAAVIEALGRSETELAALRAVARGYCPACGRGDAAPTVADWERERQRAEEAEGRLAHLQATSEAAGIVLDRTAAERDALGRETDRLRTDWVAQRQRAEHAEAANTRVRKALAQFDDRGVLRLGHVNLDIPTADEVMAAVREALDEAAPAATEATEHRYLSTGCLHGDHDYCKSMTGLAGAKRPAECKKCGAKCICQCHATGKGRP